MSSRKSRVRSRSNAVHLVAAFLALLAVGAAPAQCYYTHQEIVPPAGYEYVAPTAINNLGHVAGYVLAGDNDHAFFWTPEAGTRVLPYPPGVERMQATGINDLDHVCGWMDWTAGFVTAFLWTGEGYTLIYSPYPRTRIEAHDVNNLDQVVGTITGHTAFLWESGIVTVLDPFIGVPDSRAYAINDRSQIVGAADGLGPDHAFVLGDTVHWLAESNVVNTEARAISENGIVAGEGATSYDPYSPDFRHVGLVWDGPVNTSTIRPPAGYRDTSCQGVSNAGRVVGLHNNPLVRNYVWQNGIEYDLRQLVPGSGISFPRAINDFGQIVAHTAIGRLVLTPVWKLGDLSGDCIVNLDDLLCLLSDFGTTADTPPRGDVDLDGDVDIADLALLLSNWGT
ncbi:MAG: hypothetical protein HZB38_04360 [Planctomycetes bacterium]|nr:hypothetical protein [Planctomycetota bacterium]